MWPMTPRRPGCSTARSSASRRCSARRTRSRTGPIPAGTDRRWRPRCAARRSAGTTGSGRRDSPAPPAAGPHPSRPGPVPARDHTAPARSGRPGTRPAARCARGIGGTREQVEELLGLRQPVVDDRPGAEGDQHDRRDASSGWSRGPRERSPDRPGPSRACRPARYGAIRPRIANQTLKVSPCVAMCRARTAPCPAA